MILPVTMVFAGVAAILNIWLAIRVGQARQKESISVGDGGNEFVIRRMRAHANYVEFTPFVLILIAVVELAHSGTGTPSWLWIVASVYFLGRIGHGLGMDGGTWAKGRSIGTITTMLTLLGLGLYAIAVPHLSIGKVSEATVIDVQNAEAVPQG